MEPTESREKLILLIAELRRHTRERARAQCQYCKGKGTIMDMGFERHCVCQDNANLEVDQLITRAIGGSK